MKVKPHLPRHSQRSQGQCGGQAPQVRETHHLREVLTLHVHHRVSPPAQLGQVQITLFAFSMLAFNNPFLKLEQESIFTKQCYPLNVIIIFWYFLILVF